MPIVPNLVFRFATVSGQNIHWFLKRNCSVTPAQLGWIFAALCVMSLGVASLFWSLGASYVLGFAVVEMVAVGAAVLIAAALWVGHLANHEL